jgi:hypothetical protein
MNYFEFNALLKKAFGKHPFVNNIYSEVYRDDHTDNIVYPCVVYNVTGVTVNPNGTTSVAMIVYFIDRITPEGDNVIQVQSLGMSVITEVLNALKDIDDDDILESFTFTPFRNQFADNCAGVYCNATVLFVSDMGDCHDIWDIDEDCDC